MYFLRLAKLKPAVEEIAAEAWGDMMVSLSQQISETQSLRSFSFQIAGESVRRVDRVLDVRQGELCWVAGTVYMDMPLKPNILDDISKDVRPRWQKIRPCIHTFLALDLGSSTTREVRVPHRPRPNHA